jgi:alginate O-acetyltransferase complex protein AlgI
VAWGAFHGIFIVIDKMFWLKASKRIGKIPRVLITFVIVMIGWVMFRADTIGYAVQYVGAMFGANGSTPALFVNSQFVFTLIVAVFFAFFGLTKVGDKALDFFFNRKAYNTAQVVWVGLLMVVLLILSASFILKGSFNPFIYFRF